MHKIIKAMTAAKKDPAKMDDFFKVLAHSTEHIPFFPSKVEALSARKTFEIGDTKLEYVQRPAIRRRVSLA